MSSGRKEASRSIRRVPAAPEGVQEEFLAHPIQEETSQEMMTKALLDKFDRFTETVMSWMQTMEDQRKSQAEADHKATEDVPAVGADTNPTQVTSVSQGGQVQNTDPGSGYGPLRLPLEAMVPKFDKLTAKAHEAEAFLRSFRVYFNLGKIPMELRVPYVATRLEAGETMEWFQALVDKEPELLKDWKQFEDIFRKTFTSDMTEASLWEEWKDLQQTGSLDEYTRQFHQYRSQHSELSSQRLLVNMYRQGLNSELKHLLDQWMSMQKDVKSKTLKEVVEFISIVDKNMRSAKTKSDDRGISSRSRRQQPTVKMRDTRRQMSWDEREFLAKNRGCFYCKQCPADHMSRNCPKRKKAHGWMDKKQREPEKSNYVQVLEQLPDLVKETISESKNEDTTEINAVQMTSDSLMTFEGQMDGNSVQFMVDSGATCNVVPANLIQRSNIQRVPVEKVDLRMANGQIVPATQQITAPISIPVGQFSEDFLIADIPQSRVILGTEFLHKHKVLLKFPEKTMIVREKTPEEGKNQQTAKTVQPKVSAKAVQSMAEDNGNQVWIMQILAQPPKPPKPKPLLNLPILEEFSDVFAEPTSLPPQRQIEHGIDLYDNAKPPPLIRYRYSPLQLEEIETQVKTLLERGFIEPSISAFGAPVLLIKKREGDFRFCVDYRRLNAISKPQAFLFPMPEELLDRLGKATVYSKIDLRNGYFQIRIKEADAHKTGFLTHVGHYQFRVMPFGLASAPATFQSLMQQVFKEYLYDFVVIFLDDILVYSSTKKDHDKHLRLVLEALKKNKLYAKREKCDFYMEELVYLGYKITSKGIATDPDKVAAICDWMTPRNLKETRSFLGMAQFYRKFIPNFSKIALPLTDLTKKERTFQWTDKEEESFQKLKDALTTAPVLRVPDPSKPYMIKTDASDRAYGSVLMQENRPIAYLSAKFSPSEEKEAAYTKELMAVTKSLDKWSHYLSGSQVTIITDHHPLVHLAKQSKVKGRQMRLVEYLMRFDAKIEYQPGKSNVVADALSRRPFPQEVCSVWIATKLGVPDPQLDEIRLGYLQDPLAMRIFEQKIGDRSPYRVIHGLVFHLDKGQRSLYLPTKELRLKIMEQLHGQAHAGIYRTYELIKRDYYWPQIWKDVQQYVQTCDICQRWKYSNAKTKGLLKPLPIPHRPWQVITIDLITNLPRTASGKTAVLVAIDKYSKMAHLGATNHNATGEKLAYLLMDMVIKLHGVPLEIISDRDVRFTNQFWKKLFMILGTEIKLSTPYHPETDGQTENANRTIGNLLRTSLAQEDSEWDKLLPHIEFQFNNLYNQSTGYTPFYLVYGQHPITADTMLTAAYRFHDNFPTILKEMNKVHHIVKKNLVKAQQRQQFYVDQRRQDFKLKTNDQVMVKADDYRGVLTGNTKKLFPRYLGPYRVLEKINDNAYKIDIPDWWKRSKVINVSKLKLYHDAEDLFEGEKKFLNREEM